MSEPKIAAKFPIAVKVEAGKTYHWCTCGGSKGQPFCDGAHKGTGLDRPRDEGGVPLPVQAHEELPPVRRGPQGPLTRAL